MYMHSQLHAKESINIHVIQETEDGLPEEIGENFRFDIAPFRQTFFRYSMYGRSEVVKSSSFVYASHHSSTSNLLDVRKLSVALVGSSEIPELALFCPTVKEVYFMGHIKVPTTAFRLLTQLTALTSVVFNIGFGGHNNELIETLEEFENATPEVPTVTSLEIKMNHQLYRACSETIRNIFNRIMQSVLKHSFESFPNLSSISVDIPNRVDLLDRIEPFMQRGELRRLFEMKINEQRILIRRRPIEPPSTLPFDPYARFPTFSQYIHLKRLDATVFKNYHD